MSTEEDLMSAAELNEAKEELSAAEAKLTAAEAKLTAAEAKLTAAELKYNSAKAAEVPEDELQILREGWRTAQMKVSMLTAHVGTLTRELDASSKL
jgi:multidrug resistance efflux pump